MVKLVFIRGPSAVGKSTITHELLKVLKKDYSLDCAYISEDNFRKEMQFKYLARDLKVHINSVELIKLVILKLLEFDAYDFIFIEGQFRYYEVLEGYSKFISENNFKKVFFQLNCSFAERKRRDKICRVSKGVNPKDLSVDADINSNVPHDAILIDTSKSIELVINEMISNLI